MRGSIGRAVFVAGVKYGCQTPMFANSKNTCRQHRPTKAAPARLRQTAVLSPEVTLSPDNA
jgi:hypothetical protein